MANIQSVKVLRNKSSVTVYINLDNGRFETWSMRDGIKKFTGSQELLDQARAVAFADGKWHDYKAPRQEHKSLDSRRTRCPDCGQFDCGPNCNANRW